MSRAVRFCDFRPDYVTTHGGAVVEGLPEYLKLYDATYFTGGRVVSGYDDYANCSGVLRAWSTMVDELVSPQSVLDVGAAYGFVVQYFRAKGRDAFGIEPSDFARSRVASELAPYVLAGSLPDIPAIITPEDRTRNARMTLFDAVTCTEVMEHLPEELVPESIQAMADRTGRFLICLIMLEGPGADGDEGHICLKSRAWWNEQFDRTGLVARPDLEARLNDHPYSRAMYWTTRFFVRERV